MIFWLIPILIAAAISTISYVLTPHPKPAKPAAARQGEAPVAEAGKPQPVIFGTMSVTDPNVLWYGDANTHQYDIPA